MQTNTFGETRRLRSPANDYSWMLIDRASVDTLGFRKAVLFGWSDVGFFGPSPNGPNGAPIYGEAGEGDTPPVTNMTGRTPPEVRERILEMFKRANNKYAKPFEKDRLAWASVFGGNWEEYGAIVCQMAILDTLLSIEEKLDRLQVDPRI